MADTLKLELVSPEHLLLSEQVEMVLVPGSEGEFGVLPLHAPTLSTLKPGFVDVYKGGVVAQRFFVSGGFVEVTPSTCTVLVDVATPESDLSQAYYNRRMLEIQTGGGPLTARFAWAWAGARGTRAFS